MVDCKSKKKQEKCLKKSNLLVYQQPTGKRTERKPDDCKGKIKIPICTPQPKQIKICTGAELRKMCPPNECPCEPVKKPRFGILKLLGFGFKSAIAAAVVYITYDMGIWGTTDDTQHLYGTACSLFGAPKPKKNDKWDPPSCEAESELFSKPNFNPYAHCDEPPIKSEDSYLKCKNFWNSAISYIFHGIANFPSNLTSSEKDTAESKAKAKKEPACVSYSQLSDEEKQKVNNVYK